MESTRSCTRKKRHNRLLKNIAYCMVLFVSSLMYAQSLDTLQFSVEGNFSVSSESTFSIEIADILPSDIEIITRTYPAGVQFKSLTKSDDFIRQDNGVAQKATTIMYVVTFSKEGIYDLGSLPVMINSSLKSIDFPVVTVLPNPDILIPEIIVDYSSDFYRLKEGRFTLSARYFKRVEGMTIDLSEDALIEQQEPSMVLPSDDMSFSGNIIPLATFSCTPFSAGNLRLPVITVDFIAYNGQRHVVSLDSVVLNVLHSENIPSSQYGNERSLSSIEIASSSDISNDIEKKSDIVNKLAHLRVQEKYSFFPFEATRERIELERQENIDEKGEISYVWIVTCMVLSVVIFMYALAVTFLNKRNTEENQKNVGPLLFICSILVFACSAFFSLPLTNTYALTYGTQLYTIPEYDSRGTTDVYAGMKVEVQRSVADWYLIEQPDGRTGWILKHDCILLEKER